VFNYQLPIYKDLNAYLLYKYMERTSGDSYSVFDVSTQWRNSRWQVSLYFNNIFNTEYWESNLVPMPKGNGLLGLSYSF